MLRVDKVSGGDSPAHPVVSSDPPLHACLATAPVDGSQSGRRGTILTVGWKNCIATIDDKCVSHVHVSVALLSNKPLSKAAMAMADKLLDGRVVMGFGTPTTPEEIKACERSPTGVICVVMDKGSKFGTYVSVDEGFLGDGQTNGDYSLHHRLSEKQARAVELLSGNDGNGSVPKFVKLDAHQSFPLPQLSHATTLPPHVIILLGSYGSAVRLSLVPLCFTFTRLKMTELHQILASLPYIGATHSIQWDVQKSTHLVAPDKVGSANDIAAWASRRPAVTRMYVEALLRRRSARDELPKAGAYAPPGTWGTDLQRTAEPSNALEGYRIAVLSNDIIASLAQSAGADLLALQEKAPPTHGEFKTWWATQSQKALEEKLALVVVSSASKTRQPFLGWLEEYENVRFTNARNLAKAITGNNGAGDLLLDAENAVIKKSDCWVANLSNFVTEPDNDIEYFWEQMLPLGMRKIIAGCPREIQEEGVVDFLHQIVKTFQPDKDFNDDDYRRHLKIAAAAVVLGAYMFQEKRYPEAVHMIFLAGLLSSIRDCGGDYIRRIFDETQQPRLEKLRAHFVCLNNAAYHTRTRSRLCKRLLDRLPSLFKGKESRIDSITRNLQQQRVDLDQKGKLVLHSFRDVSNPFRDVSNPVWNSVRIKIFLSDGEDGEITTKKVYRDMSLRWLLKSNAFFRTIKDSGCRPEDPASTKYQRAVCGGKIMHLAASGDMTLRELDLQNGDEVRVGGQQHLSNGGINVDVDVFWQWLLPGTRKYLYLSEDEMEISDEKMLEFLSSLIELLPSDREYDIDTYRAMDKAEAATCVLAAYSLLKGKNYMAVYLYFYSALIAECQYRGPDFVRWTSGCGHFPSLELLCIPLTGLYDAVDSTVSRERMIALLQTKLSYHMHNGKAWRALDSILSKLKMQQDEFGDRSAPPIHSLKCVSGENSLISITVVNVDSGITLTRRYPSESTLGWWIRYYCIICMHKPILRSAAVNASTKYFRVLHNERVLFLSTHGKSTLEELGVKSGDVLKVGGVSNGGSGAAGGTAKPTKSSKKKKSKARVLAQKRKKGLQILPLPILDEKQIMEVYRQEHSRAISIVFEEMEAQLKDIRKRLNNLALQKSPPKAKSHGRGKQKEPKLEPLASLPSNDNHLGGKAGKVAYPILVGDVANLYKPTKQPLGNVITIDLHRCSQEEALEKLDKCLPMWIDAAMKGEYPWVVPVDIVCGGGAQILSEVVRDWIRSKRQVANRPKGLL